ncbi:hypothetical protein K443DRAFT_657462, partial [Laccaria amethystina LaAM-08-1]
LRCNLPTLASDAHELLQFCCEGNSNSRLSAPTCRGRSLRFSPAFSRGKGTLDKLLRALFIQRNHKARPLSESRESEYLYVGILDTLCGMKRFDMDTPIDVDSQVGNLAGLFGAMVAFAANSVAGRTKTLFCSLLDNEPLTNLSVNPGIS